MHVTFDCPRCQARNRVDVTDRTSAVRCVQCDWSRSPTAVEVDESAPRRCCVCGGNDLWRQKDFPPRLGLLMVVIGASLSTVAWAMYRPLWALGILLGFAAVDLLLYTLMPDVLVCYRCAARFRGSQLDDRPAFDLEVAERYRQQDIRLREAERRNAT